MRIKNILMTLRSFKVIVSLCTLGLVRIVILHSPHLSTRYLGEEQTSMAILDVGLYSGFAPVQKSLTNVSYSKIIFHGLLIAYANQNHNSYSQCRQSCMLIVCLIAFQTKNRLFPEEPWKIPKLDLTNLIVLIFSIHWSCAQKPCKKKRKKRYFSLDLVRFLLLASSLSDCNLTRLPADWSLQRF